MDNQFLYQNSTIFFEYALERQRRKLFAAMTDATPAAEAAVEDSIPLSDLGQIGLSRLITLWVEIQRQNGSGILNLEGTPQELLFRLVSQLREYHTRYIFYSPVGLAVYAELQYMMESLASGEWFE